jgi:zinc protease
MSVRFVQLALAALVAGCGPGTVHAPAPASPSRAEFPTTPPEPGPPAALTLPAAVQRTLPNGLTVIYVARRDLPLVSATLVSRGGRADDLPARPGLASFTAEMLDEGAGGRSALELAEAIESLGASLGTGAGWDAAQVGIGVLRRNLPQALALMADVVIRPDFPDGEIRRIRDERLTELARARDEARVVAGSAFASLLYGTDHPYGRLATSESVGRIDRQALVDFYRRFYRPGSSTLILAGDVDESLQPLIEQVFGGWTGGAAPEGLPVGHPAQQRSRIYLIDRPEAAQSEIRIGHPAVSRDNPDFYPLTVLNTLLGGSFTSRLNRNLRETHGYTYDAGSAFAMRRGPGPFTAASAVVTAKTDSAVIQFFHELNRIRDETVPPAELERAKSYVALGLPQRFETTAQIAGRVAELVIYDLPLDSYDSYVARVMAVTAEDIQRVARQYIRPDRSAIVIVGDRREIEDSLRALPIGAVEIRTVEEFVR